MQLIKKSRLDGYEPVAHNVDVPLASEGVLFFENLKLRFRELLLKIYKYN